MSTNHTTNYDLNQWEATDKVLRTEFNEDNAKIDAALKSHDDELAGLEAQLEANNVAHAGFGNCQVYTTSYTGTGTDGADGANQLTFPKPPLLIILTGTDAVGFCLWNGQMFGLFEELMFPSTTTWSADGKTVSWYHGHPSDQLNEKGVVYRVTAFMAA